MYLRFKHLPAKLPAILFWFLKFFSDLYPFFSLPDFSDLYLVLVFKVFQISNWSWVGSWPEKLGKKRWLETVVLRVAGVEGRAGLEGGRPEKKIGKDGTVAGEEDEMVAGERPEKMKGGRHVI